MLKQINNPLDHYDDRVVVFDEYSKTRMIKKNKFKYVHRYGNGPCEFYNLSNDPDEKITCSEIRNMMKLLRH